MVRGKAALLPSSLRKITRYHGRGRALRHVAPVVAVNWGVRRHSLSSSCCLRSDFNSKHAAAAPAFAPAFQSASGKTLRD
eukprot:CAMPEP_0170630396 /NCGR_PEP_ID=MMETSP0224-20130122/33962_1 /TAXON_ID=285029 /ORGANISM="Togula jolla, Strain CCCM 725" /LENGTH=79 /DNA_ID=CAMNT_0010958419 /DNA_START=571 /DNA_END=807 /DNA_ORIENTATION=+